MNMDSTKQELRQFFARHDAKPFRPVPLAQAIGAKDIRVVRAALTEMSAAGELVSCDVFKGTERDSEYRLAAGRAPIQVRPLSATPAAPRRPDARHIPSRMKDLPAHERAKAKAAAPAAAAAPASAPAGDELPAQRTALAAPTPRASIAQRRIAAAEDTGVATRVPPERATAALAPSRIKSQPQPAPSLDAIPKFSGTVPESKERGVWLGRSPRRQHMVLAYAIKKDAPVTAPELHEFFLTTEPKVLLTSVWQALSKLCRRGLIVNLGTSSGPTLGEYPHNNYATKDVAAKLQRDTKGRDGEDTPAERPVPVKAAEEAAAPLEAHLLLEPKTVQAAPGALPIDARAQLEAFLRRCDGAWYSFAYLARMAGGDVPTTLEAIAAWQREGRLLYAEADRAPIWHAVDGRW